MTGEAFDWLLTADAELRPILEGGVDPREHVGAALHAIERAMRALNPDAKEPSK